MADLDEFLVDQLYAALAWDFQELDLRLDQQVEGHFRNEEARARAGGVPDSRPDVKSGEIGGGIDGF